MSRSFFMRKALNASNISCIIKEIRTGLMYARSLQQSHNCDYVIFSSSSGGHSWPFSLTLSFSRLFPIPFSADQPQTVQKLFKSHNCDYVIFSSSSGGHSWPFSLTLSFSRLFPIPFSADQPQTVQKLFKLFPSPAGIDPGRFHTGMAQDLRQT